MKTLCRLSSWLAAGAVLVGLCPAASAAELQVPRDFPTIQAAVDAAADEDTILIASGVYTESITWTNKVLALVGEGADATIIEPPAGSNCMTLTNVPSPSRIEALSCRNANAPGGGIDVTPYSELEIRDCVFSGNSPAAVTVVAADVAVNGSVFEGNVTGINVDVGGNVGVAASAFLYNSAIGLNATGFPWVVAKDTLFQGNGGGGVRVHKAVGEITRCAFLGNSATNGGGIEFFAENEMSLADSFFRGNTATSDGGAMDIFQSTVHVQNCLFEDNAAGGPGGAIAMSGEGTPSIVNSVFRRNRSALRGGAIDVSLRDFSATLTNCTVTENSAPDIGGLYVGGFAAGATVINSILWNDEGGEIGGPGPVSVSYSDVQRGYPGRANLDADPRFLAPAFGDLRLRPDSPAKDRGLDTGNLPATELAGNPRIVGAAPDLGAYEITAAERICGLIVDVGALVKSGALGFGAGKTLTVKLLGALQSLAKGKEQSTRTQLQAFSNQVTALIAAGKLSSARGQPLVDEAGALALRLGI